MGINHYAGQIHIIYNSIKVSKNGADGPQFLSGKGDCQAVKDHCAAGSRKRQLKVRIFIARRNPGADRCLGGIITQDRQSIDVTNRNCI